MILFIECVIACGLFSAAILPPLYRNPLSQIASYPPAIRKRVSELPEYADTFQKAHKSGVIRKIAAVLVFVVLLAAVSYVFGANTFAKAFRHGFILFLAVNLFDLFVLDLGIFCHSKRVIIPGTEDMREEYKDPWHHVKGAAKGLIIGAAVSLLSAGLVALLP
jgi:hypothetical protein